MKEQTDSHMDTKFDKVTPNGVESDVSSVSPSSEQNQSDIWTDYLCKCNDLLIAIVNRNL